MVSDRGGKLELLETCLQAADNLQDVKLARRRMEIEGRKPRSKYTVAKFKRIFSSWHIYALTLTYVYVLWYLDKLNRANPWIASG